MDTTIIESGSNGHSNLTDNDIVSLTEASEILGVHVNTIRYRIKQGWYPGSKKILTVNGEAWVLPREALQREEDTSQLPTASLSHPDNVQIIQETLTRVAHEVASPIVLELGQIAHTMQRQAEELGRERQLRIAAEEKAQTLRAQLEALEAQRQAAQMVKKGLLSRMFGGGE